jgi:hypothetical protein
MAEAGLIFISVVVWVAVILSMLAWISIPPEDRKSAWLLLTEKPADKKTKVKPTKNKVDIQA